MIGKTLAHYEITSQLGKGGMGEVYQAKDTKLGRDVALKVLPDEFAQDPDRVARFQREAKLLASLNHPNIAAIYGLEVSDGIHFIVMELIEGQTLADRIKPGSVPVEEALQLALQIAEALEAAHEKGVIHRDLKPANIKITPDGKVKVLDFGLAKAFAEDQGEMKPLDSPTLSAEATRQGVILGTAAYMSPEQTRGKSVDKQADIWAFGVVLYEMLTGKSLFAGEDVTSTLARVLERQPDFSSLPTNLHPRICLLLERCLEKEARNRYSSISDARVDIRSVLDDPGGVIVQPVSAAGLKKKSGLIWIVTSIILTAIIVGGAIWTLKPQPGPELGQVVRFHFELPKGQKLNKNLTGLFSLAISQDGTQFVYGTREGLYLRLMDQEEPRLIGGTDVNSINPSFSPDGDWIAYWDLKEYKIKKISKNGGVPVVLCDTGNTNIDVSWESEDSILFSDILNGGVKRVSAKGGTSEILIKSDPENIQETGVQALAQILPGGKNVLYTQATLNSIDDTKIVVQSLESSEKKTLIDGGLAGKYISTGHLVYSSQDKGNINIYAVPFDLKHLEITGGPVPIVQNLTMSAISKSGTLIYIPGNIENKKRTLVWVDKTGDETAIAAEPNLYSFFRISPDGTKAAFTVGGVFGSDIWTLDFNRETPTRLTFNDAQDSDPLWTLDSQRIAFHSRREGTFGGVYIKNADGTGKTEHLISVPKRQIYPLSWSDDGRILITEEFSFSSPAGDIGRVELGDKPERQLLLHDKFYEVFPQVSPNGRWIAYVSNESGQAEVFVHTFPDISKGKWQVSTKGGSSPRWSPDGKELYYRNQDEVLAVSIDGDKTFKAGIPYVLFRGNYFSPPVTFFEYDAWDISPDGKRFLMIKEEDSVGDSANDGEQQQINIVLNWFEELKQRVPVK